MALICKSAGVERPLVKAFAASVVVHALLLMPAIERPQRPILHKPMAVRLHQASVTAPGQPALRQPAAQAHQPIMRAQKPGPSTRLSTQDSGQASMAQPAAAPPAPPAETIIPSANSALEAAEGEVDGEALRAYRLAVAMAVKGIVAANLPANGQAGSVILRATTGAAFGVRVASSSGQATLDEEARQLVSRALAKAPLPEALKGRVVSFDVPVIFSGAR